jgi:hypothetical protein
VIREGKKSKEKIDVFSFELCKTHPWITDRVAILPGYSPDLILISGLEGRRWLNVGRPITCDFHMRANNNLRAHRTP